MDLSPTFQLCPCAALVEWKVLKEPGSRSSYAKQTANEASALAENHPLAQPNSSAYIKSYRVVCCLPMLSCSL